MHREQGGGVAGRRQSRPGRRLVWDSGLKAEQKGVCRRNKEALGLKQCSVGTRRRGEELAKGMWGLFVYYSIVEMKGKEDRGWLQGMKEEKKYEENQRGQRYWSELEQQSWIWIAMIFIFKERKIYWKLVGNAEQLGVEWELEVSWELGVAELSG